MKSKSKTDLVYVIDNMPALNTLDRSYAIYHLKHLHKVTVMRHGIVLEHWYYYIPKNTHHYYGYDIPKMNTGTIVGYFLDRNSRWTRGRMPATKEVKYLKNYRVE